jgi:hypothetical protein
MITTINDILVNITVTRQNRNDTSHHEVVIKVYQDGNHIIAIPVLDDGTRCSLRLPNKFDFHFQDQCIIAAKGVREEEVELIKQIVMGLPVRD